MFELIRALAIAVIFCLLAELATADEPKVLFEEKFTRELDQDWSWVREERRSWEMREGTLAIAANGGSMWRSLNNYKNLLMRPAPVEPKVGFQFEVLLDNEPRRQFEHAGIACRFDDDNYVVFNKEFLGQSELLMISEANAEPALPGLKAEYEPREVWLRLTVTAGKVVGHYRAVESDTWLKIGELMLPPSEKKLHIGLIAGLGAEGRQAKFRHFRILELPQQAKEREAE